MNTFLAALITCNYSFFGAPFTQVGLNLNADGSFDPYAQVTPTGGRMTEFPLTPITTAPDELVHAWISKDTENELELIIYREEKKQGRSTLTNPKSPMGKTMWGECSGFAAP